MSRSVEAWVGRTDDTAIPPRVRLRVWEAACGRCQICGRKLGPADKWDVDHITAIVNGGAHSEANMQVACSWCHKAKTAEDVATKAKGARIRMRHAGIKRKSRPMPGSKASGIKRRMDGTVERRGIPSDFTQAVFTDNDEERT
jgi:5-methylcytosine-specific restriction endonuclease McrA